MMMTDDDHYVHNPTGTLCKAAIIQIPWSYSWNLEITVDIYDIHEIPWVSPVFVGSL